MGNGYYICSYLIKGDIKNPELHEYSYNWNGKPSTSIHLDKFGKDFYFIVNGKIYQTNAFVASIVCPYILKAFADNMNLSSFEIHSEKKVALIESLNMEN